MVRTPAKLGFAEYLEYDDGTDHRYELIEGELVEVPPEGEENDWIALWLMYQLVQFVNPRLVRPRSCGIEVPVINPTYASVRYPDLTVIRESHLPQTKRHLTISLDMEPPRFVAEVVSPYRNKNDDNYRRDYIEKVQQYGQRGIGEYWIIDPQQELVTVLVLFDGGYESQEFHDGELIICETYSQLKLTAAEVIRAGGF